ncbi:MAG: co-chaperone DjlA [Proteobacteria bacterium]|nr:co-chaperone DjlA [Pseudomonadota bacterium]
MIIYGKIFGAIFGFLIFGPLGFIIGIAIGHIFDKGVALNTNAPQGTDVPLAKKVFFKTTFTMMGYIAKVDGRVSEKEIQVAREVMAHLQLGPEQRMMAIQYFNLGKSAQYNFNSAMDNFITHCGRHPQLVQLFVEIQIQGAMGEGKPDRLKRQVLEILCDKLGLSRAILLQMDYAYGNSYSYSKRREPPVTRPPEDELAHSYKILEISENSTQAQVKKAYRKMMSQHHPDKLVAKGLPNEMIKIATEKAQRIQTAYEIICKYRGWH